MSEFNYKFSQLREITYPERPKSEKNCISKVKIINSDFENDEAESAEVNEENPWT